MTHVYSDITLCKVTEPGKRGRKGFFKAKGPYVVWFHEDGQARVLLKECREVQELRQHLQHVVVEVASPVVDQAVGAPQVHHRTAPPVAVLGLEPAQRHTGREHKGAVFSIVL